MSGLAGFQLSSLPARSPPLTPADATPTFASRVPHWAIPEAAGARVRPRRSPTPTGHADVLVALTTTHIQKENSSCPKHRSMPPLLARLLRGGEEEDRLLGHDDLRLRAGGPAQWRQDLLPALFRPAPPATAIQDRPVRRRHVRPSQKGGSPAKVGCPYDGSTRPRNASSYWSIPLTLTSLSSISITRRPL